MYKRGNCLTDTCSKMTKRVRERDTDRHTEIQREREKACVKKREKKGQTKTGKTISSETKHETFGSQKISTYK